MFKTVRSSNLLRKVDLWVLQVAKVATRFIGAKAGLALLFLIEGVIVQPNLLRATFERPLAIAEVIYISVLFVAPLAVAALIRDIVQANELRESYRPNRPDR